MRSKWAEAAMIAVRHRGVAARRLQLILGNGGFHCRRALWLTQLTGASIQDTYRYAQEIECDRQFLHLAASA
jgi:hypothetical protein